MPSVLVIDDEDRTRWLIREVLERDGYAVEEAGGGMIGILNFLDVAKMLGASRTLQKPFDVNVLLKAVAAEVRASSARAISPH